MKALFRWLRSLVENENDVDEMEELRREAAQSKNA